MDYSKVKYLDPKNDLTFRKIFGQNEHIMKSFLNSLMPFEEGQYIEELSYNDPGLIPEKPELKHSIVDVRCKDNIGRQFIVEMQMYWTNSFLNRMMFNASKAYIKQISRGSKYSTLHPVYSLSLINAIYKSGNVYNDIYYHYYKMRHDLVSGDTIDDFQFILVELPKFKAKTFTEKKIQYLWLKFLTEIDENTTEIDEELYSNAEIKEALEHLQVSAFTKEELEHYDKYWDQVRIERSAIEDAIKAKEEAVKREKEAIKREEEERRQKEEEQRQKEEERRQKEEERRQKEEERRQKEEAMKREEEAMKREEEAMKKLALKMKKYNEPLEIIQEETGLSIDVIKKL